MKIIPADIYEDGDLVRIEFHNEAGEFQFQAVWDEQDPQDAEHREFFRKWSYKMAKQLGYEVVL